MYMIKPNDNLGYSTVESTNMGDRRRNDYEAEGFRSVNELEFRVAQMVTRYNARSIYRLLKQYAEETGETLE